MTMTQRLSHYAWRAARPLFLIGVVFLVWHFAVIAFEVPPYLIPAPYAVLEQLVNQWPRLLREAWVTTYATVAGFGLAIAVGLPLAILIVYSRVIESLLFPLLVFSQSVPKVAIAPLFVVWFGFGILPKVIVAFLLAVFPIVVSSVMGLKSVDPEMVDLARTMRASAFKIFLRIRLPHALPSILSGFKVAITLAVVGAVVGEFVGANSGIGNLLQIANGNFDLPLMFAALVVLSGIGVVLFAIIEIFERIAVPWHVSVRGDNVLSV